MICLKPSGISSVEKNVLHRNDIGMIMYVLNLGASEYVFARNDNTSASVANTIPFRSIMKNDSPLKMSPCLTGIVRMSMTHAAYRPLRLPPITCPSMNCHRGVGDTITWSSAFSYSL